MNGSRNSVWIAIVKAAVAGLLYVVGAAVSGMIAGALHVAIPNMVPANVNPQAAFRAFAMLSPLLGIGLLPLALGCSGGRLTRGLALSFLMFVTMGLNEVIELRIFSTAFVQHGAAVFVASAVLPAALCGLFLGFTLSGPRAKPCSPAAQRGFLMGTLLPTGVGVFRWRLWRSRWCISSLERWSRRSLCRRTVRGLLAWFFRHSA
jgi:hypothetical protein